jgi:peptide/nickel transport system permease protein
VRFLAYRLAQAIVTAFLMVTLVFVAVRLAPGDPALVFLGQVGSAYEYESLKKLMGLDRPLIVQYVDFLSRIVRADLGKSIFFATPVQDLVAVRLPQTALLAAVTMLIVVIVGVPLGVATAVYRDSWFERAVRIVTYSTQAMATFWIGILLILAFAVYLRWLPAFGGGSLRHFVLPAAALALPLIARVVRFVRSGLLEVLRTDYVRTARSKGLGEITVVRRHALRNILIPLVTDLGLRLGWLLGGAVIIETIFNFPGLGNLTVSAVTNRDYPLVQGAVLVFASMFLLTNILVDMTYFLIDPRLRSADRLERQ